MAEVELNDTIVLIVDPDPDEAQAMADSLTRGGYQCEIAATGEEALSLLESADVVVTTDLNEPVDGHAILAAARALTPRVPSIFLAQSRSVTGAVQAMERGAMMYLTKPVHPAELRAVVARASERFLLELENLQLHRELDNRFRKQGIIGNSSAIQRVMDIVSQAASTKATVLIEGETGTGKELIAKCLHHMSPRHNKPFVALNCSAFTETLLESELFGHEKGAFTNAMAIRKGHFEYANHGTIFLDEVGDMSLKTQAKLLRVLQEREFVRVGGNATHKVDVRVISATNKNLQEEVEQGNFRSDLYYRLKVITVRLPPLRERRGDIPLLVDAFVREFCELHGKEVSQVTPVVRRILGNHAWPGNVRQLKNCIERMVVIDNDGVLDEDDIDEEIFEREALPSAFETGQELATINLRDLEREAIMQALKAAEGNREEAAKLLGIGVRTLYRKINLYEMR